MFVGCDVRVLPGSGAESPRSNHQETFRRKDGARLPGGPGSSGRLSAYSSPTYCPPTAGSPRSPRSYLTSSGSIGQFLDSPRQMDEAGAPANIGLTGSPRRIRDALQGSHSCPFFRNMGYSSIDPRGGGTATVAPFVPPRYGTLRDHNDKVISQAV